RLGSSVRFGCSSRSDGVEQGLSPVRPHSRARSPDTLVLLAIDPGASQGWARFSTNRLWQCGLGQPTPFLGSVRVVIERPALYPGRSQKARPKDIITLTLAAGETAGRILAVNPEARVEYVEPHTWKGSVPKDVHHARIWAALAEDEKSIVAAACKGVAPGKRH